MKFNVQSTVVQSTVSVTRSKKEGAVNRCPVNRVGHTQKGGRGEIQRSVNRVGHTQHGGRGRAELLSLS